MREPQAPRAAGPRTQSIEIPDKPPILTGAKNSSTARQIDALDDIHAKFPDATKSPPSGLR